MDFVSRPTTETAKALLGVKVIYEDEFQTYSGYIVETEAYLGFTDRAAHGFRGKQTPKVTSLYKKRHHLRTCDAHTSISEFRNSKRRCP